MYESLPLHRTLMFQPSFSEIAQKTEELAKNAREAQGVAAVPGT